VSLSSLVLKFRRWSDELRHSENHLVLVLSLVIGALVGLVIVAFILLTGRLAVRMYPAGGSGWRRILVPTLGSFVTGYLLWRFFPNARGSGIPQTKAALFIHDGRITFRTVVGKFLCRSASLGSGMALGREGPSAAKTSRSFVLSELYSVPSVALKRLW
jgi:CIC family chloride channel protein